MNVNGATTFDLAKLSRSSAKKIAGKRPRLTWRLIAQRHIAEADLLTSGPLGRARSKGQPPAPDNYDPADLRSSRCQYAQKQVETRCHRKRQPLIPAARDQRPHPTRPPTALRNGASLSTWKNTARRERESCPRSFARRSRPSSLGPPGGIDGTVALDVHRHRHDGKGQFFSGRGDASFEKRRAWKPPNIPRSQFKRGPRLRPRTRWKLPHLKGGEVGGAPFTLRRQGAARPRDRTGKT